MGRAVVDDEQLDPPIRLIRDAFDRTTDRIRSVVRRNHDADERIVGHVGCKRHIYLTLTH